MGRANPSKIRDSANLRKRDQVGTNDWKRPRPTRDQPPPPTLNVDVHGILFAIVAIVFVIYPLAQWALGL